MELLEPEEANEVHVTIDVEGLRAWDDLEEQLVELFTDPDAGDPEEEFREAKQTAEENIESFASRLRKLRTGARKAGVQLSEAAFITTFINGLRDSSMK